MATVLMILLRIVHVIPQKSYVCDSYITDKKSIYAGGGCIPPSSLLEGPRSATVVYGVEFDFEC